MFILKRSSANISVNYELCVTIYTKDEEEHLCFFFVTCLNNDDDLHTQKTNILYFDWLIRNWKKTICAIIAKGNDNWYCFYIYVFIK